MGKRISRRQLREDEILNSFERAYLYVSDRWQQAAIGAASVVVAFIATLAVLSYREGHSEKASQSLASAVDTFHASVVGQAPDPSARPGGKTYPSETDKYRDALKAFEEIESTYPGTRPAKVATYYIALCHANLGDAEKAAQALEPLTRDSAVVVAGLSRLTLASLARDKKEPEKATGLLKDKRYGFPPDAHLFMLGLVDEDQGLKSAAVDVYKELLKSYPESPFAFEAKEHREALAPEVSKGASEEKGSTP